MIEITPKIFAPTILSFLVRRVKESRISIVSLLKIFLVGFGLFFIGFTMGKHEISSQSFQLRMGWAVIATIIVMLLVTLAAYIFLWPNKWIYDADKIQVKTRFSTKILHYNQIVKILVESPHYAGLLFKDHSSNFLKTANWYGLTKTDWMEFVKFLSSRANINDIVWFADLSGVSIVEVKMNSPEEAYDFVLKKFQS